MNPIVRRELTDLLRTRKAIAAQIGLAAGSAVLVLLRWPTEAVGDPAGARSLQVLRVFGYGLLTAVLLVLPAFPATSLVRERVRGTLALLLNTPMSPWSIYLGKLAGVLGFAAVLLAMTVPAAAACYALGGTAAGGGIGLLYLVLAVAAVQLTAAALWVSSKARSTDSALRATYAVALGLGLVPAALYLYFRLETGPIATAMTWLGCVSPVPAVMELLGHAGVGAAGRIIPDGALVRYLLLAALTSPGFAIATVVRLYRVPLDRAKPAGRMTDDLSRKARVARRAFFLLDPRRRSANIPLLVNPVMVKEFRTRQFGRSHWMIRLVALTAIASLGLSYVFAAGAVGWGIEAIGGALVLLQTALLVLFAPSLAAGLISSERENGGWQLLRMTPLSPGAILRGKLLSVAWPLLLLLCATLPGYVVLMSVKPELTHHVLRVLACLGLTAVFAVLASAAISSLFRSTAASTAAAYVTLGVVCVVPLLVWLAREAPFGHRTVELALSADPVAGALHAAEMPGFTNYELLPANWWVIGTASAAFLVLLIVRTRQLCRPD